MDEIKLDKDLSKSNFIGKVIFSDDPTCSGRCKVRVFGLMDDLDDSLIPWFSPASIGVFSSQFGGGSFSVPKVGTYVRVRFANDDIMSGEYTCIQNVDPFLCDYIKDDYLGTHVLCYDKDEELKIVFQPNNGLTVFYKDAKLNISPTNIITAETPNKNAQIVLDNDIVDIHTKGEVNVSSDYTVNITTNVANIDADSVNIGKGASEPAVLGNKLVQCLNRIAQELDNKSPITPGMSTALSHEFNTILSSNVKVRN